MHVVAPEDDTKRGISLGSKVVGGGTGKQDRDDLRQHTDPQHPERLGTEVQVSGETAGM